MGLDARPYLGESATQSGFFCHQDSDHLAATAQHGPEDLGVGIVQRAQRRGGPPMGLPPGLTVPVLGVETEA